MSNKTEDAKDEKIYIEVKPYNVPVAVVTIMLVLMLLIGGIIGGIKACKWLKNYRQYDNIHVKATTETVEAN